MFSVSDTVSTGIIILKTDPGCSTFRHSMIQQSLPPPRFPIPYTAARLDRLSPFPTSVSVNSTVYPSIWNEAPVSFPCENAPGPPRPRSQGAMMPPRLCGLFLSYFLALCLCLPPKKPLHLSGPKVWCGTLGNET